MDYARLEPGWWSDPAGRRSAAAGSPRAAELDLPARRVRGLRARARPVRGVLPRPARADRLLQLLEDGRLQRRPRLDARQLSLLLQRPDLRFDVLGDGVGVLRIDGTGTRAGIPVRLLARALCAQALPEGAAHPRDSPVLDELPPTRLLLADDPRPEGRHQSIPRMDRSDVASRSRSFSTTGLR